MQLIVWTFMTGVVLECWLAWRLRGASPGACLLWGLGIVLLAGLAGVLWMTAGREAHSAEHLALALFGQLFLVYSTMVGGALINTGWRELRG